MWDERCSHLMPATSMALKPSEELPTGAETRWIEWKCLNRLRTGVGRSKEFLQRWGYLGDSSDLKCECGTEPQTMQHLLECPLLEQTCITRDLADYNDTAHKCVQHWLNRI